MSKIGKREIIIPQGVEFKLSGSKVEISGPKGKLALDISPRVEVKQDAGTIKVLAKGQSRESKAMWGTTRSLLNSMVLGVSEGFEKKLEVVGVGYRVAADKKKVTLSLGYSHPIELPIPEGLEVKVEKNTIAVSGADKRAVGQFAAVIREQRKPEPYKGKGVKYADEVVRRKAGKVMKAAG